MKTRFIRGAMKAVLSPRDAACLLPPRHPRWRFLPLFFIRAVVDIRDIYHSSNQTI